MWLLDKSLAMPAENLALDEALLVTSDTAVESREVLRLWESPQHVVVLGRSSRAADEVDLEACRSLGVEVVRRTTGGAAVVIGPGCLMYSVFLSYRCRPELRMIERAHRFVLGVVASAVGELVGEVQLLGTSDLTLAGRKFSGNSLRCKRQQLLYHGTLLYDFPLELISQCLRMPPRQPDYRAARAHNDFLTSLGVTAEQLRQTLVHHWQAHRPLGDWPRSLTAEFATEKFADRDWTFTR